MLKLSAVMPPSVSDKNSILEGVAVKFPTPPELVYARNVLRDEFPGIGELSANLILMALGWVMLEKENMDNEPKL
jgi:hypothetical protein